jgi:plasmid maintenance system killer protein
MDLDFNDAKLKKLAESRSRLTAKYGQRQADRITERLAALRAAERATDLLPLPGRWHELSADYQGHYSADLVHPYRLLVRPAPPVPRRSDGGVDWYLVTQAIVVGIEDTH